MFFVTAQPLRSSPSTPQGIDGRGDVLLVADSSQAKLQGLDRRGKIHIGATLRILFAIKEMLEVFISSARPCGDSLTY